MDSVTPADLVVWLRAAGEPSRLRLLALCTDGALSVSELAHAIRQSEPRVSRHLRILCQAGLLLRLRQGQWVHYRLADDARAAGFVRGLLAQLDRRDPGLVRDRTEARSAATLERDGVRACTESRLGRALAAFAEESGLGPGQDAVLAVGVEHPELLASVARAARSCTVIAHSRRAAQSVRALAERSGFACRVLTASRGGDSSDQDLSRAGAGFDAVLLDPRAASERTLAHLLERAGRLVVPGGRLWLFQRYESLESSRERVVEHPLARLRRLLNEAGLVCERLSPIEADGEHILAAAARPEGSVVAQGAPSGAVGGTRRAGGGP